MCQEIIVLKKLRQSFPNSGGDNGGTPPGGKDRQQTDWKHPGTHLQLEQMEIKVPCLIRTTSLTPGTQRIIMAQVV